MRRLNILSLTILPNTSKPLAFQKSGTGYYLRPWNNRIKDKVRNHVAGGKGCLKLLSRLPKNANDFVDCVHNMDAGLQKLVGAMGDSNYSRKWWKRARMRFLVIGDRIKFLFRELNRAQVHRMLAG